MRERGRERDMRDRQTETDRDRQTDTERDRVCITCVEEDGWVVRG